MGFLRGDSEASGGWLPYGVSSYLTLLLRNYLPLLSLFLKQNILSISTFFIYEQNGLPTQLIGGPQQVFFRAVFV